ncbi:MAG: T9SS type A sorting domain-containing protein [Brumimicrobium sp.]|nr:T9SS type A sorting domain-containing protein [Brumimicrobium sp.]
MKKHLLLIATIFSGAGVMAQFTQSNEPQPGEGTTLYVIDSLAPDFGAQTGSGASWDYSSYGGYGAESRTITVLAASSTADASYYPSSTTANDIEGFLVNYTNSNSTERSGQGFVYRDQDFGDIIVVFDQNEALQYNYPFALSNTLTDLYSGTAYFTMNGTPQTAPAAGELTATVDGQGTLTLADGVSFTNVTRYKLEDSTTVSIQFLGDFTIERTQYEYYDLNNSTLPVFVHTHVWFGQTGGGAIAEFNLVMSAEDPNYVLSVEENELSNLNIYPNPANNEVNIKLPESTGKVNIRIVDAAGRTVLTQSTDSTVVDLSVEHLDNGIYFVNISNGSAVETKRLVIK